MSDPVKTRRYKSDLRAEQAAATRQAVLVAARDLFTRDGWAGTPVAAVARHAGVSVDTVYTSVGRKPALLLAVVDMTLAGSDQPVPAEQRDYVRAVRAAPTARAKLGTYARALAELMPTLAPLLVALRQAAVTDADCRAAWERLGARRRANMLLLAADLRVTGELRRDLSDDDVADIVWITNAVEVYELARLRGRDGDRYAALLTDLWVRTLLT